MNAETPNLVEILTSYISLSFHATLSTATGEVAVDVLNHAIEHGEYVLVVEGSIPVGMPEACMLDEEPITTLVLRAARNADVVVSVGSCASFGGIPGAENNPTGAVSVATFLKNEHVARPVINLPGCPAHPDWTVGTLIHVLKFGFPILDSAGRPTMFYARLIHDQCPRFSDYERERFAKTFSDDGCLFKLGCLGPTTHADCTLRLWNGRTNYCIKASAPCIGCASQDFALRTSFPFYTNQPSG
jgi:hydrogenase small subunit